MKLVGSLITLDAVLGGAAVWVIAANTSCAGCEQNVTAMLIAYCVLAILALLTVLSLVVLRRHRRR